MGVSMTARRDAGSAARAVGRRAHDPAQRRAGDDPGVPGALSRALGELLDRMPVERLDRVWVFPPLRRGRRESGLLAAGCFGEGDRRLLLTVAYRAEETGKGIAFESAVAEEGEAPADRLPRVILGVVRRAGGELGEPRCLEVAGDRDRLADLIQAVDPEHS